MKKAKIDRVIEIVGRLWIRRPGTLKHTLSPGNTFFISPAKGCLKKLGRGLYRMLQAEIAENHSLAEACKKVPNGIICLFPALRFHGLATRRIYIRMTCHSIGADLGYRIEETKMASQNSKTDNFKKLTWDDLEDWAGSTIVSRGQNYQRSRYVQELGRTPGGGLVAWVLGTKKYATRVEFEDGGLTSDCTCPYGATCKHAVAVVLEYLHLLKQKKEIPEVNLEDRRFSLLEEPVGEEDWDKDREEDEEEDFEPPHSARPHKSAGPALPSFLEKQTKEHLLVLLQKLAERFPAVREALQDQNALESGSVKKMVSAVRREIHQTSSEPGWRNNWSGEGYTPDYSGVKDRLEALLAKGHADEVVSLGKDLFDAGNAQVEMSHDEGETGMEISSCLEVVFRALSQSSLSPVEQMLWAVNVELEDEYDLCYGAESFWKKKHKTSDWSILADKLLARLNALPPRKRKMIFRANIGGITSATGSSRLWKRPGERMRSSLFANGRRK